MKKQAATNRPANTNTNRVTSTRGASGKKQEALTSTANRTTEAHGTRGQATAKKQAPGKTKTGGKQQKAQREAAPSPVSRTGQALIPIRTHQSRSQIIAAVAADTGVQSPIVDRVARSLSMTLTRHLVRNGSGRVEIPYMNAALYVGRQAAMKARTIMSPILGRNVQIPARKSKPVARFRPHSRLRELVART